MRISNWLIIGLCCLSVASEAISKKAATRKDPARQAKKHFRFDRLPGKDGPVRTMEGFDLKALLKQYDLNVVRVEQEYRIGRGVVFIYALQGPRQAIDLTSTQPTSRPAIGRSVRVHIGASPADAHEMLFGELADGVRNVSIVDILPHLERLPQSDTIGEFCIVTKPSLSVYTIRFARGNVAVSIDTHGVIPRQDLFAIAKQIDRALQKQPIMTKKQVASVLAKPQIQPPDPRFAVERTKLRMRVILPARLAEGQSIIVKCDHGSDESYDQATGIAICRPSLPGLRRIGVAVYDKKSHLTRWAVVEVQVRKRAKADRTEPHGDER